MLCKIECKNKKKVQLDTLVKENATHKHSQTQIALCDFFFLLDQRAITEGHHL